MRIKSAAFTKALHDELADRRMRVKRLKDARTDEVYKAVPEMRSLDESLNAIVFDLGKQVMNSDDPAETKALAEKVIADRKAERTRLLKEHGFPEDYLEPKCICPDCMDTGRIGRELCHCVTQLAVRAAFDDAGVNSDESFENFDLGLQKEPKNRKKMSKLLAEAMEYADNFPNAEQKDLVYFGPTGVGKTYLLNCIGGRVLKRGYSVLKINAYRLIQMTLDNLRSSPEDKPDFSIPDLLIIDDLGTEPMINTITVETLLSILCDRQDSGKATIFATNLEIIEDGNSPMKNETLESAYGERFVSRLMDPRRAKIRAVKTGNVRLVLN